MMHLRRLLPILACAAAACPKNVQRAQPDAGLPEVDAGAQVGAPDAGYDAGPQPLVGIAAPATAYFGDPVTVDAVVPADLTVDTYFFLFGDGSGVVEQTSPHASHVYRSAGTFHILLTVRDASRSFLSASATIVITRPPLMAALSAPPDALVAAAVTFDASGSSDIQTAITSYTFDFGDGSPAVVQAEARATHTYDRAGAFRATVTVRDPRGAVAAASVDVVIGMQLSAPITLQHSSFLEQGARIALEASSAIDVAYEYGNLHLMFTRSTDTGASFSTPVIAAHGDARFEFAQLAMATTGKGPAVHIVATMFDTATGGAEVAYVKSTAGAAFSAPASVSQNDGVNSLVPAIDTDGDHRVFVAWEDSAVNGGDAAIWFARSDDEGASFSAPVALGKPSAAAGSSLGCPNLARGKDQDVLLLWLQGPDFHGQFYLARSTDSGQSFAAPVQLFARIDRLWCPQLLADTLGRLLLIWGEGDAWATRMFSSRSTDSGATWSEPALLLPNVADVACASAALRDDGELALVFSTAGKAGKPPNPDAPYASFVRLSSDAGATFGPALPARVVNDQSACPALAMPAPGRIALVWNTLVQDGPTFAADLYFSGGPVSMP